MDALFQTQSNELSTTTQKEKLFKDAERQWNTLSTEKGAPGRKVDEIGSIVKKPGRIYGKFCS